MLYCFIVATQTSNFCNALDTSGKKWSRLARKKFFKNQGGRRSEKNPDYVRKLALFYFVFAARLQTFFFAVSTMSYVHFVKKNEVSYVSNKFFVFF